MLKRQGRACLLVGAIGLLAWMTPTSALAAEEDVAKLLDGITEIGAPGAPGPLCVYGDRAFPIVLGGSGKGAMEPVVAAARAGEGWIVAFGHPGYLEAGGVAVPGTGRLVLNAARWAAGKDRQARLVVYRNQALQDWLKQRGWDARAADLGNLDGAAVLLVSAFDIPEDRLQSITRFVEGGGGLLIGGLGWGWAQLNPTGDLPTQFMGNRLLERWGIAWADGFLERTGKDGYTTDLHPSPLAHAGRALNAALAQINGTTRLSSRDMVQVSTVVTHAAASLPPGDRILLPRVEALGRQNAGDAIPSPQRPIKKGDLARRLSLALQINILKKLPAEKVRAHPAGAIFPGDAPARASPVSRTVTIDTRVPGWHSLGLYAAPGARLMVRVPTSAANRGLGIRIGAHTDTLWGLDEWKRAPEITRVFPISRPETIAANAFGGLVYITVPDDSTVGDILVTVSGAVEAPLYVLGKTSLQEWGERTRLYPGPWAELATDKVVLTVPSTVIHGLDDPEALMKVWDRGMDAIADLAGISRQRRRPERIVADEQISAGYMHSGYPVMTFLDAASYAVDREKLLAGDWGHWHELGHNHQVGDWTFEGTGEVTNNVFVLYVFDTVSGIRPAASRQEMSAEATRKAVTGYIEGGADFNRWKSDPFLALTMYLQLQQAFGWETYKKVFAEYRALPANQRPTNDDEKRDQWMVRFSRAAGRNLGPFFQAWGVPTSEKARASIAELPEWMPEDFPVKR